MRISLLELQRLIDLYRVDPNEPIDLTTLCNTGLYHLDVEHDRQYGFQLTEEGIDDFVSPVNIEVQYASEPVIAAIERNGGSITTRFYDLFSVWAKQNPLEFFQKGIPIPNCKLPPVDAIPYYTSAESRGYLADPRKIEKARVWLSQKYGYRLAEPLPNVNFGGKSPRQIFFGLSPGSLVSLVDKVVLKPKEKDGKIERSA
ncbi:Large subunit ribosomal protein L15 [Fasciolopsis buskii]|uniref:Large ribosomal subunit protein uL15m n=1 Tax=Fasciolopsis buskii TaxID=27845 RepID=A0A8E0S194_9TREM|nr:Large subunit ribosomal protein L15 [Fasciolopsis buski]